MLMSTADEKDVSGVGAGGHEEGGFYSIGRKSYIHSINEKAVIVLPDMATVERGFSDKRLAAERAAANYKSGPFSEEEV